MKVIIALLLLLAVVSAGRDYEQEFRAWTKKHSKSYGVGDFQHRFQVWRRNQMYIDSFNAKGNQFTLAMNSFGDLPFTEFQRYYLGLKANLTQLEEHQKHSSMITESLAAPPATMDWRQKGAVTPVKNQGQCGSCWSFSTTGSTEGCHQIKTSNLVSLSEQNLVDCSGSQGNQGCNGGLMTDAMNYIIANKGIDTEKSYPYTARDGTCHFDKNNIGATLTSYSNIQRGSESALQTAGVSGPVSVAIDASHSSFQFYSGGVYYEPACSSSALDHGVLMIGWGSDGGKDFWLVKNSWGTDWGKQGYIEMSRNRNNNCGIATMATIPHC